MFVRCARVELGVDVQREGGGVVSGHAGDAGNAVVFGRINRGDGEGVFIELGVGGHFGAGLSFGFGFDFGGLGSGRRYSAGSGIRIEGHLMEVDFGAQMWRVDPRFVDLENLELPPLNLSPSLDPP